MGKDKNKPNLKVKTSRYFTKTCSSCGFEYPNWFVSCPKCGTAWDEATTQRNRSKSGRKKKNIKIVVKIAAEDFEEPIDFVNLIFSADHGKNWYQMKMDTKMDYFIAEIADVPLGTVVIYYIDVYLENGEKVTENNNGKYFYYKVGIPIQETQEETPPQADAVTLKENIAEKEPEPQDVPPVSNQQDDVTIFGTKQTKMDPDLKVCPHCNSKIKRMWSICPICGQKV